jgi:hypothetical protein
MPTSPLPISRSELTRLIAPCGLYCGGCLAFAGGAIRNHARALRDLLGPNFEAYARRMEVMNPVLCHYTDFAHLLDFLSLGSCKGCRDGGCLMGSCGVRECAIKREMDFCGLCPDFPCEKPGLPEGLLERWRKNGEILRDKGPALFLELARSRPRYP